MVGKAEKVESHVPWWDKIGVDTALNFKEAQNWHHPAMTDEEIEELVQQMPTDLELAGLSRTERDEYLRARFSTLQAEIARARSARKRSPNTFEPVKYDTLWSPAVDSPYDPITHYPKDAHIAGPLPLTPFEVHDRMLDVAEQEALPPHPYGPRLAPPPLPELTYWNRRKDLLDKESEANALKAWSQQKEEKMDQKEAKFEKEAPWLSSNESVRVEAEKKLRSDRHSKAKIAQSIATARKLRMERWELLEARNKAHIAQVKAQGGHERLAWHQFTDEEWKTMSDVEFAYWRHEIAMEWMKANPVALKNHDSNHPGTVTIALRKGLEDWQRGLYEYERIQAPPHLSTDETAVWHYELSKTSWYKAGQALEARLVEVEKRAVLHRRSTVLDYLCQSFNDWANYYATALENAAVLEKWGLKTIGELNLSRTENETHRARERLTFQWISAFSTLFRELQHQKQLGPFPFDTPVEKIDQHVIDKIYARIILEEESVRQKKEAELFAADIDLPPIPLDLKAILSNPITMLISSGDSADSGLFGTKLLEERAKEVKRGISGTVKEMDRRRSLMHMYWSDHGIKEVEVDGKKYAIPESEEGAGNKSEVPYEVVERCYFNLLDEGIDVHGLYEKPQWEVDEAGRYRMSTLSPLMTPPPAPVTTQMLDNAGRTAAINLLNDLVQLAYPQQNMQSSTSTSNGDASGEVETISVEIENLPSNSAEWSHIGFMEPTKPRSKKVLQLVMGRGHPTIVKAERAAAFYSTESEPVDPHPHLWQRLLNITWRMQKPPTWLISKFPEVLGHWRGVTEQDMDVVLTADEKTGALRDPRTMALENPMRKAWELSKMSSDYKSMLLGKTLTDRSADTRERLLTSVAELRASLAKKPAESTSESSFNAYDDLTETSIQSDQNVSLNASSQVDSALKNTEIQSNTRSEVSRDAAAVDMDFEKRKTKFLQIRRDIIPEEEINAAQWALRFDFKALCKKHMLLALGHKTSDIETLGARFNDSFLMNAKEYIEPSPQVKSFEQALSNLLRMGSEPQELLELETQLFHRRQRIQTAYENGMPSSSTAMMMYYYHAYALRSRIELLLKSEAPPKTSLSSWASRYLTPTEPDSPFPRTIAAAIYQIVTLPFHLVRYAVTGTMPFARRASSALGAVTSPTNLGLDARQQSQKLVELARHLERMSLIQPWNMWTNEPWTWRTSLMSDEARTADSIAYVNNMNEPRAEFWKQQKKLWEDFVDSLLGLAHQLAIEQRIGQGISTDKSTGHIDGTTAHKIFCEGEELLNVGKYKQALDTLAKAARAGSSDALLSLGKLHSADVYAHIVDSLPPAERLTQPQLEQKSRRYLCDAIAAGQSPAIAHLVSQCMRPPQGAGRDMPLAARTIREALEIHNMPEAKVGLANLYELSTAIPDMKFALSIYRTLDIRVYGQKVTDLERKIQGLEANSKATFLEGRV